MSYAIKDLKDFLTKSPSVVFPDEVLGYVDAIEAENDKMREFVQCVADGVYKGLHCCNKCRFFDGCYNDEKKEHDGRGCQWLLWARELGIEVGE